MRILLLLFISLSVFPLGAVSSSIDIPACRRSIRIEGPSREYRDIAIAVPRRTPLLDFAARELSELLARAGCKTAVIEGNGDGRPESLIVVLGSGVDVSSVPPEGFRILRSGKKVFISGKDSPTRTPRDNAFAQWYARGTLTGVYDFLERFAGVRFYFPGELGTVVPRRNALVLPEKIDLFDSPDKRLRYYPYYSGAWPKNYPEKFNGVRGPTLSYVRLRGNEMSLPYSHSLSSLGFIRRFGKSHPEYFALLPDGKRYSDPRMSMAGQLCLNSGIREEIYLDMISALRGEPASKRGVLGFKGPHFAWSHGSYGSGCFGLMPQDWLYWCGCEKCSKIAPGGRESMNKPQYRNAIGEFIWKMTVDYADRLRSDGISGLVFQMSYPPYDGIPEVAIPENVRITVAMTGGRENSDRRLKAWNSKTGRAPLIWTYPGKHMAKKIFDGIPAISSKRQISYYGERKNLYSGVNHESETDYWIFNHLEYYLFAKQMWNADQDMKALYDEYFKLMFGAGAKEIESVYSRLEELWNTRILGRETETELGPVVSVPTLEEAWNNIYSPAEFRNFDAAFNRAEKLAADDPDSLRRIRFIRTSLIDVMKKHGEEFRGRNTLTADWKIPVSGKVFLRPLSSGDCRPATTVEVFENPDSFVFVFVCTDPEVAKMTATANRPDDKAIFRDSNVELLLNPSGDRKHYFHWALSASGALYDAQCEVGKKLNSAWQSGGGAKIEHGKDFWKATLTVPKKSLGTIRPEGFPVNFCRTIVPAKPGVDSYRQWSPVPLKGFHEVEHWGTLVRNGKSSENLIGNGDFSHGDAGWKLWRQAPKRQIAVIDDSDFISGGGSLLLENREPGKIMNATRKIPLKPGRKYRLSYDVKTELSDAPGRGNGAGAVICMAAKGYGATDIPASRLRGERNWRRISAEFTTDDKTRSDEAVAVFWLWGDTGKVRYDRIVLEELP